MAVDHHRHGLRQIEVAGHEHEHDGLPAGAILSMCDRLLDEVGRRDHRFAWLRAPGSSAGPKAPSGAVDYANYLAVDAYYPRARLVVMCRAASGPNDALYRELIPARGLGLMTLDPESLGDDPAAAQAAVAAKILDLEHVPRPERIRQSPPDRPPAPWTPVKLARAPVTPAAQHGLGVVVGLALVAVLVAELCLAVLAVAFGAGRPILGVAIALEACSRGLGTLAAERAGERAWAFGCAVGGAPLVAWFALAGHGRRSAVEPAPLAGLLALVAGVLALLGLLIGS